MERSNRFAAKQARRPRYAACRPATAAAAATIALRIWCPLRWPLGSFALPPPHADEVQVWSSETLFAQEASLRRELANLLSERSWLHSSPEKEGWTLLETNAHLQGLQQEVATLRNEVAMLRREQWLLESRGTAPDASRPPPPMFADHGPTIFATMCAGTAYFDAYCGTFLASFERAYGSAAGSHRVVVFHASVDQGVLNAAKERFGPWAHFEALPRGDLVGEEKEHYDSQVTGNSDNMVCGYTDDKRLHCQVTEEGSQHRGEKVDRNNFWFPVHVSSYAKAHASEGYCHLVLIDSDTLFVRPLGQFLPDCASDDPQQAWDVGFTVYDPNFLVPWAETSAEVGRTRSGLTRLNTGVVLVRLHDPLLAEAFLLRWAQTTIWLSSGGEEALGQKWEGEDKARWEVWREELVGELRAPAQAGLALLLCSYQTDRLPSLIGWETCSACTAPVTAQLDVFEGEVPTTVRLRALPARMLNHPESMIRGSFPSDLLVVHLKGQWWRAVLPRGAAFFEDPHRKASWNRDAIGLHKLLYETWHAAVPPEVWPSDSFQLEMSPDTYSRLQGG